MDLPLGMQPARLQRIVWLHTISRFGTYVKLAIIFRATVSVIAQLLILIHLNFHCAASQAKIHAKVTKALQTKDEIQDYFLKKLIFIVAVRLKIFMRLYIYNHYKFLCYWFLTVILK